MFALLTLGGVLFALLLICIILTCWKRRGPQAVRNGMIPGVGILPHKTLTSHKQSGRATSSGIDSSSKLDRRAMIEDTSSETSEDSCQLPYVTKKVIHNIKKKHIFLFLIYYIS